MSFQTDSFASQRMRTVFAIQTVGCCSGFEQVSVGPSLRQIGRARLWPLGRAWAQHGQAGLVPYAGDYRTCCTSRRYEQRL